MTSVKLALSPISSAILACSVNQNDTKSRKASHILTGKLFLSPW